MFFPTTHIAFGVLGARLACLILGYSITGRTLSWGALFGFLPDFDYIYYLSRYGIRPAKYSHEHRQAITHSFFPHIILAVILFFIWGKLLSLVYFFSVFSHLILDSIHSPWGLRWFWPFSQKYYSLGIKTGISAVNKKELDEFTQKRGDQPWIKRFVRIGDPYFIFEDLTFLGFVIFLIYLFIKN